MDLINLGFKEILVFGTPLLTVIFAYLLLKRGEGNGMKFVNRRNMLRYAHYSLLFAFIIITMYSVKLGSRPLIYFFVVASLFVTSVLYGMGSNERGYSRMMLLTVFALAISVPVAILGGNNFCPRGFERNFILQTGSMEGYFSGMIRSGLYYYIPISSLISVPIALITGQTIITPLISNSFFLLGTIMGVYVLFRRLSHKTITGVIGAFFFMSVPSLTLFGRMPGLTFAIFYVLITLLLYESPRASVIGLLIVSLPMIFMHPSGFVAVTLLLTPLALLSIKNWPEKGTSSSRIRLSVLTTVVLTFTYWVQTYLILLMTRAGVNFYSTLCSYLSGAVPSEVPGEAVVGQVYVPNYYYSGYDVFAYSWSVPIALSVAFLFSIVFQFIRKKKFDPSQSLTIASALVGPLVVFLAYLTYPRGEVGQYLIPVGYFLSLLSSSAAAAKLMTSRSRKYTLIAGVLLASFVLNGTFSPDWAPLEHPEFKAAAYIRPYRFYQELETVKPLIPENAMRWSDYDFLISASGKLPRNVILQISSGVSPAQFARGPLTLFAIRSEHFSGGFVGQDVIYSSGPHLIVAVYRD